MTPSSGLQRWLTELRKVLYFLLLVYHKGYNSGIAKWKRDIGRSIKWRFGRCTQLPCLLRAHHPPSTLMYSPTWRLSEPCFSGFFVLFCFLWRFHYAGPLDYIIHHWWMNSVSSPSPLPRGGPEDRAESSNSNHLVVSLAAALILKLSGVLQESPY